MGLIILLLIIGTPTLEIFVFIEIGGQIGPANTLIIVCITAIIGAYLLRRQGLGVLTQVQHSLSSSQLPVKEIFDGFFILIAGVSLLMPGFVTDSIGFLLFVPPLRSLLRQHILTYLSKKESALAWDNTCPQEPPRHSHYDTNEGGTIIDGNFEEIDTGQKELEKK